MITFFLFTENKINISVQHQDEAKARKNFRKALRKNGLSIKELVITNNTIQHTFNPITLNPEIRDITRFSTK